MAVCGAGRPRFWIIAGPNGSGKSTAYGQDDVLGLDGSVWIINPDLLTARLQRAEKLDLLPANLAAVERIKAWLEKSIWRASNHWDGDSAFVAQISPFGRTSETA